MEGGAGAEAPRFEDASLQLPGFLVDVFAEFQATDALAVVAKGLGLDHIVVSGGLRESRCILFGCGYSCTAGP